MNKILKLNLINHQKKNNQLISIHLSLNLNIHTSHPNIMINLMNLSMNNPRFLLKKSNLNLNINLMSLLNLSIYQNK
jgi:hypothetical protein